MIKRILRSGITTLVLSVLAIGFIGFGGVNTIQAAPRVMSEYYGAQVRLTSIDTAVTEFGNEVEGSDQLLQGEWRKQNGLKDDASDFVVGKSYKEELAVRNTGKESDGAIPEFVRVTVRKYWVDSEGNELKNTALKPEYIDLHFVEGNGWTIDKASSTEERTVLYYSGELGLGETSQKFTDKLAISSEVVTAISSDGEHKYEGVSFKIDVQADAVQNHNASAAKGSAWGKSQ